MFPPPTYFILLTLCWMYALLRGGKPERIAASIMIFGTAVTSFAFSGASTRYGSIEIGVFLVDLAVFAGFAIVALRSDRYWPIWATACVGLCLLGHLGRWYAGADISRVAYWVTLAFWSYPPLALIAIGTWNHQRRLSREDQSHVPSLIAPRAKA